MTPVLSRPFERWFRNYFFRKGVSTIKYCARFATIAVEKGYITAEQAKAALLEQLEANLSNNSHRLIGSILFEKGWMTVDQIDLVLDDLFPKAP